MENSIMIVSFDTYTNEEIVSRSVLRVKSKEEASSAMLGTGEGIYCSICENPKECIGHLGYISLKKPIFHPMYIDEIISMLRKVCVSCFRPLDSPSQNCYQTSNCQCNKSKTRRFKLCSTKTEHYIECKYYDPKDKSIFLPGADSMKLSKPKEEFKLFPDSVSKILASYKDKFICTVIPVAPNCIRTSLDSFDIVTKTYHKILWNVDSPGAAFEDYNRLLGAYRSSNKSRFDLESIKSLKEKMTGKTGFFRKYSLGKRTENCARAVISPDPCLCIDEVGVPSVFAENMHVSLFNPASKRIEKRSLKDGDIVLLNRQPSLQRHSLLSFKVKLTQEKTIMINPLVCSAFNADFDGDEMNLFCPGNYASIAEAYELLSPENCFLSPQNNSPIFYPILDSVSCLYILSSGSFDFGNKNFIDDLIDSLNNVELEKYKRITLTSSELKKLVNKIYEILGAKKALYFIEECQKLSANILMDLGFSIGYDTCRELIRSRDLLDTDDQTENAIMSKLLRPIDNTNHLVVSAMSGAKGSMDNIIQIACCVGEQHVTEECPYSDLSRQKDFCKNSFMSGLNPAEYFFHAQAGREGVISTSMRTPKTGYIHRKLARALEDCVLHHDGTVRTIDSQGNHKIVRFQY